MSINMVAFLSYWSSSITIINTCVVLLSLNFSKSFFEKMNQLGTEINILNTKTDAIEQLREKDYSPS